MPISTAQMFKAIEESNSLEKTLIENSDEVLYFYSLDSKLIYVNPAFKNVTGFSTDELYEKNFIPFVHPDDLERTSQLWEGLFRGKLFEDVEYRIVKKSGETKWCESTWKYVLDQHGTQIGIQGNQRDITFRKKLRLQLEQSELRFKDFASCAADVFWETDAELNYRYVDGRVSELLDRSSDDFIGEPLLLLSLQAHMLEHTDSNKSKPPLWEQQSEFKKIIFHHIMPDSSRRTFSKTGKPIFTRTGEFNGYRGVLTDITEPDKLHRQLEYQANHDDLTGLLNRRSFEAELLQVLDSPSSTTTVNSLCYLDLDQFKVVNDIGGHEVGDRLLMQVSKLMQQQVRSSDILARLGGDEFGLLLPDCPLAQCQKLANRINNAVSSYRLEWEGTIYQVGISIGMVEINQPTDNVADVLAKADLACYAAKDLGRNQVYTFRDDDGALLTRKAETLQVQEIRAAMSVIDRMQLYLQPIAAIDKPFDTPTHYELLLRLFDETGKMSLPGLFIAAAERYDLMGEVDRWVIQHAFHKYAKMLSENPGFVFSINLSGRSLSDVQMGEYVVEQFRVSGCPPTQICFEITETSAIGNLTQALEFMTSIRDLGCRFSLDDFGSGLSSLSQLHRLPVDVLKIDGSLIQNIMENETNRIMVDSICNIGKSMKIQVVAEYVENEDTLKLLDGLGVNYVQGYLIGRPAPEIIR